MKVAVVGGGISGLTIIRKLLSQDEIQHDLTIDLFDKTGDFIVGAPYTKDTKEAIMNEHAQDLSIIPEKPDDFLDWLRENHADYATNDAFVPREYYGGYLFDRLVRFLESDKVVKHQVAIVDYDTKRLQDEAGQWYEGYDAIFFTIGHPPYADYYELEGTPNYINHPVPLEEKLSELDANRPIGIIGTGLTALDVTKYLLKTYDLKQPLRLYTNDTTPFKTVKFTRYQGDIHLSFSDEWIREQADADGFIGLQTMVDTFLSDLATNGIDIWQLLELYGTGSIDEIRLAIERRDESLGKLRRYIVMMTIYLSDLYNALTPMDRDRYHNKYERIFNHFRSQIPVESLQVVLENLDNGRLEIVTNLEAIMSENNGFVLKTSNGGRYEADYLINCTGFQFDIRKALDFDPLIKNLYNREILTPYFRGGAMVTWPHCQIVSSRFGVLPNVYMLGHWISKIHYGNNNIHLCIKQAERVADAFIAGISEG
ncbi:FAD/NAD(P)-binding protein [Fundicoccus culcitae]|uniref:FAD/NAD(P)-binding protein n=1 Tax=Fundicoccus culcitae TaxID=2969821 RepID=A0ABY5P455_9LACT|nr:FAD/NAD(P)-binding protein [Fundicoccus culcitae]UUX33213.1 FAD/NAD(P)-binding protein [Fundicoccus culcitae]